jgi:hypothetical protein
MKIQDVKITDEFDECRQLMPYQDLSRCYLIKWTFNGKVYDFSAEKSKEQLFIPILCPSYQEIVLFLKNYSEYSSPCNVIVINGDTTLRFQLCPPELISEQYKNYEGKVGKEKASNSKVFIQPDFYESSGNLLSIWIGFNYDWYEVREFNLKTGEFGRCLRASRM